MPDLRRLSKLMSLVLRHEPERFGLLLDPEGFVPLAELVAALRQRWPGVTPEDIVAVVDTVEPDKQRFTIVGDSVRANYGHSVSTRIAHAPAVPPEQLYHGTSTSRVSGILAAGLKPMQRQYVHLTTHLDLARRVGARHGEPRILCVDAVGAHRDGVTFYVANSAFWLVDAVPAKYLNLLE